MSDLLTAASEAMNVPEPLVERSARARAEETGASYEDILTAWAGGEAVAASAPEAAETSPADESEPEVTETPSEPAAPVQPTVPTATQPTAPARPAAAMVAAPVTVETEEEIEPLPLADRVRIAGKIGAWTGVALGLVGLVVASTWLLSAASVAGEEGAFVPAVEVTTSRVLIGVALFSVVFGVVVAALSRTAAEWTDPGARLEGRSGVTVGLGAILGLVLGAAAGAVMVSAFAEPVEGAQGVAIMRIIPSAIVVLVGGAVLGFATAALVQLVGVPSGVDEESAEEIQEVRSRLSAAVSIPLGAVLILGILVLPLGLTFIRSNEFAAGGAAVLAILAAAGILGFATLSASRPTMRISFGEFLVAAAGIATVVLIIFAVFSSRAEPEEEGEGETATEEEVGDEGSTETTVPSETAVPAETTAPEAAVRVIIG